MFLFGNSIVLFGDYMFLFGNVVFLFGDDMFLFENAMFVYGDDMFLFANDMFPVRNDIFLFGKDMFLFGHRLPPTFPSGAGRCGMALQIYVHRKHAKIIIAIRFGRR